MAKGFFPKNERDSDLDRFRFRIVFAAIAVLLAFAILLTRFSWLQIVRHEYYITRAEDNRISLGCVVVDPGFFESVVLPALGTGPSWVYVLPEEPMPDP